jgi:hypothetical protein
MTSVGMPRVYQRVIEPGGVWKFSTVFRAAHFCGFAEEHMYSIFPEIS